MEKDGLDESSQRIKEWGELIKHAQQQPGIKELTQAYGYYDRLVKQSNAYLTTTRPKAIVSTNSSS